MSNCVNIVISPRQLEIEYTQKVVARNNQIVKKTSATTLPKAKNAPNTPNTPNTRAKALIINKIEK